MLLTTENYLDIFLVTLSVLVQWILVPLNFEASIYLSTHPPINLHTHIFMDSGMTYMAT